MRKQEMYTEECQNSLLDRVRLLHPWNPEGIVANTISCKSPAEIRLLISDGKMGHLIAEVAQLVPQLPPRPSAHSRPQFYPVDSLKGIQAQAPVLWPHLWPQFHPIGISHGFQAPLPQNVQIGPVPSSNFLGIHAPVPPIGPTGAFQSTFPEFTGTGNEAMLEKEIRELLFLLQPPRVPIESLANMYIGRYGKPLRTEGFCMEGQQHGKACYTLTDLLMQLNTTRVIERQGQHFVVPVEDAPKYLAHGFKLAMLTASSDSTQIYITFRPESTFTEKDIWNYFSRYGTVNEVRIPPQEIRNYGYVSFLYPGTAKRILSERVPHLIGGDLVRVKAYKEKHQLEQERNCFAPAEDAPKYLAHGFKLVRPPPGSGSNQIFITFDPKSMFTKHDAWNYFSHYGPVHDVRILFRKKHAFGFVSFLYPETVTKILSERSPRTSHFICGDHVFVEAYKEKQRVGKLAGEASHSISGAHKVSDASFVYKHHTGEELSSDHELFGGKLNNRRDPGLVTEKSSVNIAREMVSPPTTNLSLHSVSESGDNTADSSNVSDRLDEAAADQDCKDLRLPETLDGIY